MVGIMGEPLKAHFCDLYFLPCTLLCPVACGRVAQIIGELMLYFNFNSSFYPL